MLPRKNMRFISSLLSNVVKYKPIRLFQAGLMVLKIAAATGRLSGFPVPEMASLMEDAVNQMCKAVDSELQEEAASLFAKALDTGAKKISEAKASIEEALPAETMKEARTVVEKSASWLEELLEKQEPEWKSLTGLKMVRSASDDVPLPLSECPGVYKASSGLRLPCQAANLRCFAL